MSLPNIAIYTRVSTSDQANEGLSLEQQLAVCLTKCREIYGERFTYEHFEDAGKSGGSGPKPWQSKRETRDRKGLWHLIEGIKARKFQGVACYRIDRLYRDYAYFTLFYKDELQARGIDLILVADEFDKSLAGQMQQEIVASFSEYTRRIASDNCKRALNYRRNQGYYQGTIPFGWRKEVPDEYEGRRPHIRSVPEQGDVVKSIAHMYLSGMSELAIARDLNARNVPHKKSCGKWRPNTVSLVLVNPTHAGLVTDSSGKLIKGLHYGERYYDESVLAQIHDRIERNRNRLRGVARTQPFRLFSGLATCGHCGKRLSSSFHTSHPGYRCLGIVEGSDGAHVYISAKQLEQLVVAELAGLAREPEVLEAIESEIETLVRGQDDGLAKRAREISNALVKLCEQEDELIDALTKKLCSAEVVKRKMKKIEDERLAFNVEFSQIDGTLSRSSSRADLIRRAKAVLPKFDAIWDQMTDTEQREALHLSIEDLKVFATDAGKWIELKLVFKDSPVRIEVLQGAERYRSGKPAGPEALTARELAALKHVLDGANYAQIAKYFSSTPSNAHCLLSRAKKKLRANTFEQAAQMAAARIRSVQTQLPLFGKAEGPKTAKKRLKIMEYQLIKLASEGRSVREIALQTGISAERAGALMASGIEKTGSKSAKAAMRLLDKDDSFLPVTMMNRRRAR